MIAIAIVGHGRWAQALAEVAQELVGSQEGLYAFGLQRAEDADALRARLTQGLAGHGSVLILSDVAGGTPHNVARQLASSGTLGDCVAVSGGGVPLLVEVLLGRPEAEDAHDLAQRAVARARAATMAVTVLWP